MLNSSLNPTPKPRPSGVGQRTRGRPSADRPVEQIAVMTDAETTTVEILMEALQHRASLHTQCADTTVMSAQIDLLSTG